MREGNHGHSQPAGPIGSSLRPNSANGTLAARSARCSDWQDWKKRRKAESGWLMVPYPMSTPQDPAKATSFLVFCFFFFFTFPDGETQAQGAEVGFFPTVMKVGWLFFSLGGCLHFIFILIF